jgi:hypothetical protein
LCAKDIRSILSTFKIWLPTKTQTKIVVKNDGNTANKGVTKSNKDRGFEKNWDKRVK